jgi:hypothetical protein
MEFEQAPLLMLGFPLSEDAFLVGLAGSEQVIKDASELHLRSACHAPKCEQSNILMLLS